MVILAPTLLGAAQGSASTLTITTTAPIIAGNLVVVAIAPYQRSISSVSDGTNNYIRGDNIAVGSTNRLEYWYIPNAAAVASSASLSCSLGSGGGGTGSAIACQVSGIRPSSPIDSAVKASLDQSGSGSSTPSKASGTPTTNSTIIFGAILYGVSTGTLNLTDHAPFTTVKVETNPAITSDNTNLALAYAISTSKSAVTYAPTFSDFPDYDAALITGFKGNPSKSFGTIIA